MEQYNDMDPAVMWTPGSLEFEAARLTSFMDWLRDYRGLEFDTYRDLWSWSVSDIDDFWQSIVGYFGVVGDNFSGPTRTLEGMPGASWFPDATINYAENILRHAHGDLTADEPAIVSVDEADNTEYMTWRELETRVAALTDSLRKLGVQKGDRVAAVLPNTREAIVGFLATASIGAIWSICSPDLSATAVLSRLRQLEPRVLFGTTGYQFKGKLIDREDHLNEIEAGLSSSVHTTIVVGAVANTASHQPPGRKNFETLVKEEAAPDYDRLPFEHPLWVLFSSGTTGDPKGIVHGHGGMLLEALKTFGLNQDLGPSDLYYVAANTSWMVWNTLLHALATGAGVLVYAGSPTYGGPDRQFEIVATHRVTAFTTGAAYLSTVEKAGRTPKTEFDFSALRTVTSTASPLPISTWCWVHESVKADLHLGSDSGGTDICSVFIGSNLLEQVRLGQIQGPMLGVDVQAWDELGNRVVGEVGEMVITTPLPAMPVGFWADHDDQKYMNAYFNRFPGFWTHGDWITETPEGGFVVHGRSDATLNRDGVRLGSADIYNALQYVPEIHQSLAVGVELPEGEYYQPLFVSLIDGTRLDHDLEARIVHTIRQHASARHVPDEIVVAPDIPITHAGKKIEVPIKRLLGGHLPNTVNIQSLANPESIDWFTHFAENLRLPRRREKGS